MKELFKYLPMLVKYAGYLKYAPFLITLIGLVKEAERKFREAKSGAQKLAWAREQFATIVDAFESAGLVDADLANALRDGAEAFITAIVQLMNAVQGGVDGGEGDDGKLPPADLGKYGVHLTEHPKAVDYPNGGKVYQYGDEQKWTVEQLGAGIGKPMAPWHEVDFA